MFKQLREYPNYQININGDLKNSKDYILKRKTNPKTGYQFYILYSNGHIIRYVHRLVAQTFINNTDNKKCVNHIDFNKENNNIDNLEWVTHKENIVHFNNNIEKKNEKIKKQKANYKQKKYNTCYSIIQKSFDGKFIRKFNNVNDAVKYLNIQLSTFRQLIGKIYTKYVAVSLYNQDYKVYNPDGTVFINSIKRDELIQLELDITSIRNNFVPKKFFDDRFEYGGKVKVYK